MSVQMEEKLNLKLFELLEGRQLSISGLSRELKAGGIDEHRLILTGYLRALRDLNILEEFEVPPSKIYALPEKIKESLPEKIEESFSEKGKERKPPEPSDSEDIYSIFTCTCCWTRDYQDLLARQDPRAGVRHVVTLRSRGTRPERHTEPSPLPGVGPLAQLAELRTFNP